MIWNKTVEFKDFYYLVTQKTVSSKKMFNLIMKHKFKNTLLGKLSARSNTFIKFVKGNITRNNILCRANNYKFYKHWFLNGKWP